MLLQSKPSDFKNVDQLNKNDEVLKEGDKEHKDDDGDSKNGDEEFKNGDVELKHGGKDAIKLSVQRVPAADLSIEDFRVGSTLYTFFYFLSSGCLLFFVCLYPVNAKTTEPIGPNFF